MNPLVDYVVGLADRSFVLSHRLIQCLTHAPEVDEEVALANIALDLLGQARLLYGRAGEIEGKSRTEDNFAHWRDADAFRNPLLVEVPNGDFAHVMVRQLLHDAFAHAQWTALRASADPTVAAVAAKSVNETAYHLRHSSSWVVRLGGGTAESHRRSGAAVDALWPYAAELFEVLPSDVAAVSAGVGVDPSSLRGQWLARMMTTLTEASIKVPEIRGMAEATGGRLGRHSAALTAMLDESQSVARAHPGASW